MHTKSSFQINRIEFIVVIPYYSFKQSKKKPPEKILSGGSIYKSLLGKTTTCSPPALCRLL